MADIQAVRTRSERLQAVRGVSPTRLVFLDFETTGLDPATHEPIELAIVVTDDSFRELAAHSWLIRPEAPQEDWEPVSLQMHRASRLTLAVERRGLSRALVAEALMQALAPFAGTKTLHLAGNSVHFDRGFLRAYFPSIERLFHHRHLDVSSIRMLGERATKAPQLPGDRPHRAMEDVRRSIAELKHWTAALKGELR